jgi:hypothetical protein
MLHSSQSLIFTSPGSPYIYDRKLLPPLARLAHQSTPDWIPMHVAQLLNALAVSPDIEVIEAGLPDAMCIPIETGGWPGSDTFWECKKTHVSQNQRDMGHPHPTPRTQPGAPPFAAFEGWADEMPGMSRTNSC